MEQRTSNSGPYRGKFGGLQRRLGEHFAELLASAEKVTGMARLLIKHATIPILLAILSACTVGPDYVRPKAETPPAYKELEGWKKAEPSDHIPRGSWWTIFNDPELNSFEEQVDISNQNLAVAEAQYRGALALVQVARAAYFPTVSAGPGVSRSRTSADTGGGFQGRSFTLSDLTMSGQLTWEIDLWGKIRRQVESSKASAQGSAADIEGVRLSAHAQLAQDYFQLRALDSQKQILETTVAAYQKFLDLTKNRYATGVAAQSDVQTAQVQLDTAKAQLIGVGVQRAQFEHAIAMLMGKPPSDLTIPAKPLDLRPPEIPVGIPSELLERRPDIAAVERQAAAANAQIGVATAAFYPTLTLNASGGFEASDLAKWFAWPSRVWTLGPASLTETIFEGGLRRAQLEQAKANYDASAATYRQTVLAGFQQVEDQLAALWILEQQAQAQDIAVNSARKNVEITVNRYKAGTASPLDVITTEAIALTNELNAAVILGSRMTAAVLLVQATGGGWSTGDLPSDKVVGQKPYKGFPW
jgi:NodT family efflux transporter outer membrane factor (OMF) lipoprotein